MIKKGQVWVETVIYTLIGIGLMALVLSFLLPKINQSQDKAVVEQSIETLNSIEQKMQESMGGAAGSARIIPFLRLKKGSLIIDGQDDTLKFIIEGLKTEYSQPDVEIPYGRMTIKTEKISKNYKVTMEIKPGYDILYRGQNILQIIPPSPTPYKLSISNANGKANFEEISGR